MNIVLENTIDITNNNIKESEEQKMNDGNIKKQENQPLGTVMIRGNSIVFWECLDKIPNK